ncbi:hypothetical protein DYB26_004449 [Aphanomyces astaci]|uniref:N-acetyltransferase domain-containing protein n=1 Tax=Aphanomyces astaci TaxID=112090 RepID=A0A418FB25_APHAT|nr:hypothetical protein DYB26_004449 [Aphanomyces astaci]
MALIRITYQGGIARAPSRSNMRLDVKIQGDLVRLVPYAAHHVHKYHNWMKDPFLLEMTASEPLSLEEEQQMQVTWREDPTKATFIVFATTDTETEDEMAGDVNLFFNDDEDTANCEIDIMVAEARYRGKGVGREAVLLMMSYAVTHLHVHRFYCKINETNEPSLGLFRKYDFLLLDFRDKAAGAPTEAPDEEAAKAELAAVEAQDEDDDDESDTNEEDTNQNRLLYLISLYTKPAILSTDKEEWIRKPALLVLLYEAIVSQAVDYDYAPASELIENKRKYFNISQEGKSDLDFLREEELLNGLKLASKSYQPVTCYQISEKGQELVAKLGKADKSPIHDMRCRVEIHFSEPIWDFVQDDIQVDGCQVASLSMYRADFFVAMVDITAEDDDAKRPTVQIPPKVARRQHTNRLNDASPVLYLS